MNNEQDLQQIEISMEQAKEYIAMATALQKLQNNEYFKKIFTDGYLRDYAVRLVKLKSSMGAQSVEQQRHIDNQILGIGQMNQYMQYILQEGRIAEKALADDEAEHEGILAESLKGVH